jgi:hypothetical protein
MKGIHSEMLEIVTDIIECSTLDPLLACKIAVLNDVIHLANQLASHLASYLVS